MSISYSHIVLIAVGAMVFLVILLLVGRRHWLPGATDLQSLLRRGDPEEQELYHHFLIPLLVYEDQYPSFLSIMALVLDRFPFQPFLNQKEFRTALTHLRDSVFQRADQGGIISSMSTIVQIYRSDPEVEFNCRPHLEPLVEQFLKEVEA